MKNLTNKPVGINQEYREELISKWEKLNSLFSECAEKEATIIDKNVKP